MFLFFSPFLFGSMLNSLHFLHLHRHLSWFNNGFVLAKTLSSDYEITHAHTMNKQRTKKIGLKSTENYNFIRFFSSFVFKSKHWIFLNYDFYHSYNYFLKFHFLSFELALIDISFGARNLWLLYFVDCPLLWHTIKCNTQTFYHLNLYKKITFRFIWKIIKFFFNHEKKNCFFLGDNKKKIVYSFAQQNAFAESKPFDWVTSYTLNWLC